MPNFVCDFPGFVCGMSKFPNELCERVNNLGYLKSFVINAFGLIVIPGPDGSQVGRITGVEQEGPGCVDRINNSVSLAVFLCLGAAVQVDRGEQKRCLGSA